MPGNVVTTVCFGGPLDGALVDLPVHAKAWISSPGKHRYNVKKFWVPGCGYRPLLIWSHIHPDLIDKNLAIDNLMEVMSLEP